MVGVVGVHDTHQVVKWIRVLRAFVAQRSEVGNYLIPNALIDKLSLDEQHDLV